MDDVTQQGEQPSLDHIATSFPTKTPGGQDLPTLAKVREWHTEDSRWRMTWMNEAERLEGMIHAYQWTREQELELENQGRKAVKSPHIAKVIWSMVGWRAANKFEIKYLPRGASDQGIADARTKVAKFVWDQNSADYLMGDACMQQYVGPMGWVFVGVKEDDPTRDPIVMDTVSWREMLWDHRGKKLDLSDAKRVTRERWMALEDAQAIYPEWAEELERWVTTRASGDQGVNEYGMSYTEQRAGDPVGPVSTWPSDRYLYAARKEVRLVECWYRIKERGHYLQLPDGRNVVFDASNQEHQYAVMEGGTVRPGIINRVYTMTFTGDLMLEHMASPYDHGMFPYVPVWGLVDQKGIPYGITRLIEDEQLIINWSTSKLLWVAASRQAYVSDSADMTDVAANLAKPDGLVRRTNPGDVEIIPQADMASLNANLLQNALNNMREIAGSTDEMRGQSSDAKSGIAIARRQDAALRQQGRFLDNEQRAMVMIGQILSSLMDQVYTTEKVMRITESNGKDAQAAINVTDPFRREQLEANGLKVFGPITQGEYDCVVSTAPLSTTQRETQFDSLTQLMGQLDPQVRLALLDTWVDAGPWANKDEIVQRIQQIQQQMFGGGPQQQGPSPEEAQMMQQQAEQQQQQVQQAHDMQMQGMQLDHANKAADLTLKQQKMAHADASHQAAMYEASQPQGYPM